MSSKFHFYLTILFAVFPRLIHKNFKMPGMSCLAPGIAALFLCGCFRQCHRLSLPLPIAEFSTKQLEKDFGDAAYATIRSFVLKFEKLGLIKSTQYGNRMKYAVRVN